MLTSIARIQMLAAIACTLYGCSATNSTAYTAGFDYEHNGVVCPSSGDDAELLLQELVDDMHQAVASDPELSFAADLIEFSEPALIGYKAIESTHYVQYLYENPRDHSVMFPGEGGIAIVVEACSGAIEHGNFFRFPA